MLADSQPTTPQHRRGAAAAAAKTPETEAHAGSSSFLTPRKNTYSASSGRRFDRTPTNNASIRRGRVATIAVDSHVEATTPTVHRTGSARTRTATTTLSYTVGTSRHFPAHIAAPTTPTRPSKKAPSTVANAGAKTALSVAATRAQAALNSTPTRGRNSEFTFRSSPTADSPELAAPLDRAHQQQPPHLEFVGAALLPSLSRRATISEHKHASLRIGTPAHSGVFHTASEHRAAMAGDSDSAHSSDEGAPDAGRAAARPGSQSVYEIPNDNENDGQYAAEFWLNALVPKPHTNFFGYEASIGPICISISTRESHECYKALVRTPFKFGVVYVPTVVINQPIFGTDLDRLSSPSSPKILLYHALRLYFQQADTERRGYLLTAFRNRRLAGSTATAETGEADGGDDSTQNSPLRRGLQRTQTRRSNELRRAEISAFMDTLFDTPAADDHGSDEHDSDDAALGNEINSYLAAEREQRDLAVATESLIEIRDDHLKPLLRNLEPRLFRRWLRLDFVIVGAAGPERLADANAPHQRFLRSLERANARARGDPGAAGKAGSSKADAKAARGEAKTTRTKTREEMEAKRANIIEELVATERSYVDKLRALIDIYVVPLRSAARSANNALIPAYDAHVIFGNIERVTEVNERFLGDLEAWAAGEMDPRETIGSLCRDHFVDFQVYKRYINGYQHALASSRELEAKNPLYAAFLQRAREREECRKLGISDLLIMPVQRIPRYTLLLTDLLRATPPDADDAARIRLALERVNEIGQLADNQVAESVAELHRIHTTVEGCPPNLISASREFVGAIDAAETDLVTGAPKRPVTLLVFSDLLMVVERFWPPHDHGGIRVTEQPGAAAAGDTAFQATVSDPSRGKRWGRFSGWVDIGRVSVLEKTPGAAARSFYIHRTPAAAPPGPEPDADQLHNEFARILYPAEAAHEPYGEHGYWFPQSLHEFEADHAHTRDAFFEFLNTAWERSVARCLEPSAPLSRQGSGAGSSHRRTKSGIEAPPSRQGSGAGHPELDRVDVGGQSWSVRMWDAADYARSRAACPAALAADMTIVWDYRRAGAAALPAFCPLQACRVIDCGDDFFHVTSTVLPLHTPRPADAAAPCAELLEERDVADSWPALCRLVEQAVAMYQYVLLAYPEHRRVQQCYNRSILASLFGQNALGSSSSVKPDTAVSAAPRKLFSRARHLFSSGKLRGAAAKPAADHGLFASAYSNAVAAETVGPAAAASAQYAHSTISTPLTVLGRYKLKTKSSTMAPSRRVQTLQSDPHAPPPSKPQSAASTPGRAPAAKPALSSSATFSAGDASMFSLATTASSTSTRLSPDAFPAARQPSHTIDDFPSFSSSMLTDDSVDIRSRSHTSWEQRTRATSCIKDALGLLPASLTGSSPSLPKLGEPPAQRAARPDVSYTKRRSMSVVSAASPSPAVPPGVLPGDGSSEFSLSLDILQPRGDRLSIPDDLKLEFDTALSGASSTPPLSTRGLALDITPASHAALPASGLSVLIPSSTNLPSAASTWDMVSPDYDVPPEYQSYHAPASAASATSTAGSRGLDRRRGVYGAPPHSAAAASPELIRPQVLSSEADILLDIARELGEDDEPFNNPASLSSLYVDADDVARHLSSTSLAPSRPQTSAAVTTHSVLSSPSSGPASPAHSEFSRPLPSTPAHSRSLNYGSDKYAPAAMFGSAASASTSPVAAASPWSQPVARTSRIPHPPSATYSLHHQPTHPAPSPSFADYRRLPSLPPRVRSAAAPSYLDRSSTSPAGRQQPAFPPF
ncbi:hypothetical protein H4R99_003315 [Coemansia sp. RSA 1722]|nr:hypothetical protein H4R99_003315 [Coemansia sp. RSA 1722]